VGGHAKIKAEIRVSTAISYTMLGFSQSCSVSSYSQPITESLLLFLANYSDPPQYFYFIFSGAKQSHYYCIRVRLPTEIGERDTQVVHVNEATVA
jgi:hypothetical protein